MPNLPSKLRNLLSLRHSKTPERKFHLFPLLPAELRDLIWAAACLHPRTITIYPSLLKACPHGAACDTCAAYFRYLSSTPAPALLSVSKEAREVGMRVYRREFGVVSGGMERGWSRVMVSPPRIWVNWEVDVVVERGKSTEGTINDCMRAFLPGEVRDKGGPMGSLKSALCDPRVGDGRALRIGWNAECGEEGGERGLGSPFYCV